MNTTAEWAAIDAAWKKVNSGDVSSERMNYLTSDHPGSYQAKVYKAEPVSRNQKLTINWKFQVISGEYKGYLVSHTTWLDPDDEKSMARAARDFVGVGHEGSPSSFVGNLSRYVDSIVNITVRSNTQKHQFPWVDINGVAQRAKQAQTDLPPGVNFTNSPAQGEKYDDDDIPF